MAGFWLAFHVAICICDQVPLAVFAAIPTLAAALAVRNLAFRYGDDCPIFENLTVQIAVGDRVGLIGPNGAGKTTFFLLCCGILVPQAGEIHLFGQPVQPGEFRSEIGLVFQNPSDQLFSPSVWDDVAFGPVEMGLPPEEVARRVEWALDWTGTADLRDRAPHHLSGGQKRMVAIAGVLACQPRLTIYDEPSANLDLRSRRRLIQFFQTSAPTLADLPTTLISSHDLELILETCNRVLLLDGGDLIADGDPMTVMGDRALMEAHGLELPYSLR